ncbi:hypothetical protein [Paraburkholderia caledonica]|uniref:hypothetical protein n=1 Tax=Paraburkholderia caledonica TaxID=134536 RepID=UPI000DEFBE5D|nr:hypothetical protein [Paraburkholderia caledonica]AXF18788.1 hypothetical protein CUJ87_30930 [Paraburkholderia caledonica]
MPHISAPRKPIAAAFAFALFCASSAALCAPQEGCVTPAGLADLQQNFFARFPDAGAFRKYVDSRRFELRTNAPAGRELETNGRPTGEKIDWVVKTLNENKELFSGFVFDKPDYAYMKGQLRGAAPSIYRLRSSKRFPKNECVQEVTYSLPPGACVMSQRMTGFSFAFVKDERPMSLRDVEMFFIACDTKQVR